MTVRHIAVRVHGRFQFPKAPKESLIAGTFEFFYVEQGAKWVACVEWRRGVALSGANKIPTDQLAEKLEDCKSGADFCFRLDQPAAEPLEIPGAMVFDQYKDGNLDLRLLLAREFNQGATPCHSAVVLGGTIESDTPCFGFVIALPTPGPQGVIDGKPHYVFPFRVRFLAKPELGDFGDVAQVGWIAAGVEGTASASEWTTPENAQVKPQLGKFGFCYQDPQRPFDKYVQFPRRGESDPTGKKRNALWLLNKNVRFYRTEFLDRFANTNNKLKGRVTLNVEREDQLSIWLAANDDARVQTQSAS